MKSQIDGSFNVVDIKLKPFIMEAAALDVVNCIRAREKWKLQLCCRLNGSDVDTKYSASDVDIVELYRLSTVEVIEKVVVWRSFFSTPFQEFIHEGKENYLLFLASDLEDRLGNQLAKVKTNYWKEILGVKTLRRNPLLLHQSLDDMINLKQKFFGDRANKACQVLLIEEGIFGRTRRETASCKQDDISSLVVKTVIIGTREHFTIPVNVKPNSIHRQNSKQKLSVYDQNRKNNFELR
jgi:hypothetical protein